MSEPKVIKWTDGDGRVKVNVEILGFDVTIFQSDADNKLGILIDTNDRDANDVRVYLNETVIHGGKLYDIHDIEKNFSVVFNDPIQDARK